jgi:hypothetical protein
MLCIQKGRPRSKAASNTLERATAAHRREATSSMSLNDYHRDSSIDFCSTAAWSDPNVADFVGGSVSLIIDGSILMS